jgi:tetratricopeptide (TPR) repeat protein
MEDIHAVFNEILAKGPSPGTLLLVLSRMKKRGELKEVIRECRRALSINPDDIHIRRLLAEAYLEEGELSQAGLELEKVTARIDELISCYSLQAEIFHKQGRDREAVQAVKLYLAHRPDDEGGIALLGRLQKADLPLTPGRTEAAEDNAEESIKTNKKRMITILESWLSSIHEWSETKLHEDTTGDPKVLDS